jgi:hypothetical protein
MYFDTKNYLKNTRNHTTKHAPTIKNKTSLRVLVNSKIGVISDYLVNWRAVYDSSFPIYEGCIH